MAAFLGRTTPILRVVDMDRALRFYSDALGFHTHWGDSLFASIGRDQAVLMLTAGDQGAGRAWAYIGLADVDVLHTELLGRGTAIRHGPCNYPWGAREMQVADPDGNVLRFGSDATDEPYGSWMDENGTLWSYAEGQGWTKMA